MKAINRRNLVKAGFGALAAPAALKIVPVNAQSRVIKIGHISPRTGPIAPFGEADPFILDQISKLLEKGISNGGRTYPVQIVSKDSQSSTSRASEVASWMMTDTWLSIRRRRFAPSHSCAGRLMILASSLRRS